MSEKAKAWAFIAIVVAGLVALTWLDNLRTERTDLRKQVAEMSRDYDALSRVSERFESRVERLQAALPKVERREYLKGRADGIAYTCNTIYGNGYAIDDWTHVSFDEYGQNPVDIRAIVIVDFGDGSTMRITRADCRRFT